MLRVERRRATNRLRDLWKRDPWASGSSIDLGDHEATFQTEAGHPTHPGKMMAPAVLDWLRWRYRRLQVDRRDDLRWGQTLRTELPLRVNDAGPAPSGHEPQRSGLEAVGWTVRADAPSYKRQASERSRLAPRFTATAKIDLVARIDGDPNELAMLYIEHREVLAPILARFGSDDERRGVLVALRAVIDDPNNASVRKHWLTVVQAN